MLEPPDELLEDLQSALPPEQPVSVPRPGSNSSRSGSRQSGVNGAASPHDHLADLHLSDEPERASVTSSVSVYCIVIRMSSVIHTRTHTHYFKICAIYIRSHGCMCTQGRGVYMCNCVVFLPTVDCCSLLWQQARSRWWRCKYTVYHAILTVVLEQISIIPQ